MSFHHCAAPLRVQPGEIGLDARSGIVYTPAMSCNCASNQQSKNPGYQYAVKFICGESPGTPQELKLNSGSYRTTINVHNPSYCETAIVRAKRVFSAKPTMSIPGEVEWVGGVPEAYWGPYVLLPDHAKRVDTDVLLANNPNMHPGEGWVVIESNLELDVVAVYTAGGALGGAVSSIHTERVPARCVELCGPLDLYLNTGTAAWEVLNIHNQWVPAVVDGSRSSPISGAVWITAPFYRQSGACKFRLCFKICAGAMFGAKFQVPNFLLQADDAAVLSLNGAPILAGLYSPPYLWHTAHDPNDALESHGTLSTASLPFDTALLRGGENCFEVTVKDRWSDKWGFLMSGNIRADYGMCPGSSLPHLPCNLSVEYRAFGPNGAFGPSSLASDGGLASVFPWMFQLRVQAVGATVSVEVMTDGNWSPASTNNIPVPLSVGGPIQAVRLKLLGAPVTCKLKYRIKTQSGMSSWVSDGGIASNQNVPIQGIEIDID